MKNEIIGINRTNEFDENFQQKNQNCHYLIKKYYRNRNYDCHH